MPKTNTGRRVPTYQGVPYWEKEKARTVQTDLLLLSYYPIAGKLQISQAFKDRDTGELRRGKTVTLDQEDIALHSEALKLLAEVLEAWG